MRQIMKVNRRLLSILAVIILACTMFAVAAQAEPDSKLYALYNSIRQQDGIHLNYDLHVEKLGTDTQYDVHCKDGMFYSRQSFLDEKFADLDMDTGTYYKDGEVYSLEMRDQEAILATTVNPELFDDNILLMDDLYSAIFERAKYMDYYVEEREMDGSVYLAEVYPAAEIYPPEGVFLFNEDGSLAYYIVSSDILGESIYKVNSIDDEVDESVFDISDYEIKTLD